MFVLKSNLRSYWGVWFSKGAFVIRKIIMKARSRVEEMSIHLYVQTISSLMLGAQ